MVPQSASSSETGYCSCVADAIVYDLAVVTNQRLDKSFLWKRTDVDPQVALSLAGFTAVMVIYMGDEAIYTSTGDDPDIQLAQEPEAVTGRIDITLGQDLTAGLLMPLDLPTPYHYRLDLIDDTDSTNIIPFLRGTVTVLKGY